MSNLIGRFFQSWRYACAMGTPREPQRLEPERRPAGIDCWAGMWVAVKDGEVIASANNSRDLVPMVRELGESGQGAVAQFVPYRTDDIVIGLG